MMWPSGQNLWLSFGRLGFKPHHDLCNCMLCKYVNYMSGTCNCIFLKLSFQNTHRNLAPLYGGSSDVGRRMRRKASGRQQGIMTL